MQSFFYVQDLEEDEGNLEDFMKFINVRQELKLFQQQQSVAQLPPSQQQEHEEAKVNFYLFT